jgi:RND family efflux transporter MFP subunit
MPPHPIFPLAALTLSLALIALSACGPGPQPEPEPLRPVRVVTVEKREGGETVSLTGRIEAEDNVALSFRVGGRMIARTVNVGDRVEAGQVVARLDPEQQEAALRAARASLAAAMSLLTKTRNEFGRQDQLLRDGWTTRARHDQALQAYQSAQAQVDSAHAQVAIAEDNLSHTVLVADAPGHVTARGAEPGEVVAAGRMIVRIAREGGRDAIFDVPAQLIAAAPRNPVVSVVLTSDPQVRATGRVREVAPQADPVTRTFEVKVGLINAPEAMRLGSTVTGSIRLEGGAGISVPSSALVSADRDPAVWVVDPGSGLVSLRNVEVERFDLAQVIVSRGLEPGDVIVTAGVQALRPGQKVRLLGATP